MEAADRARSVLVSMLNKYAIKINVNCMKPEDNTVWFKFEYKQLANLARSIIFERLKN